MQSHDVLSVIRRTMACQRQTEPAEEQLWATTTGRPPPVWTSEGLEQRGTQRRSLRTPGQQLLQIRPGENYVDFRSQFLSNCFAFFFSLFFCLYLPLAHTQTYIYTHMRTHTFLQRHIHSIYLCLPLSLYLSLSLSWVGVGVHECTYDYAYVHVYVYTRAYICTHISICVSQFSSRCHLSIS